MKSLLAIFAMLMLAACTSESPTSEVEAAPLEFVEVEPEPQAFTGMEYKTPAHLRSTGGDNCAPLPETGVATLYCDFVQTDEVEIVD